MLSIVGFEFKFTVCLLTSPFSQLPVTYTSTVLKRHPTESRAADYQFEATSDWQYAIDPKTAKWVGGASPDDKLASPIFDAGKPPVGIEVSGCLVDWKKAGTSFAAIPPTNPVCKGQVKTLELTPYGVSCMF